MPTVDRKLHALSGASALAREENAQIPSFVSRILADYETTKSRGRDFVEANVNLTKLRRVKRQVAEAIKPIVAQIDEARANPDLTENGRQRLLTELQDQLHGALYKVVEEYNGAEQSLLDSFPRSEPRPTDLSDADVKRVVLLVNQLPHLSPAEFATEFKAALAGMDRAAVQALLPIARSRLDKPEFIALEERKPISSYDRLDRMIDLGEKLLRTGRDGWKDEAHTYAREVAHKIRAQMDTVAETVINEGQWEGTVPARMRRGDGRLGAVPDLLPLDGEPEVEVPFGGAL